MKSRGRSFFWLLFGLFIAGAGYLWWQGAPTDFDTEEPADEPQIQAAQPPATEAVKPAKLDVRLKKGDTFPLRKTVTETVTQQTAEGPIENRTILEILMAIRVQDVGPKKTRLRVDYQHVEYRRTLGEEKIHYDSNSTSQIVPLEAQPYRGLINNGFEFWIGADHSVIEVVDFQAFLERCVRHVSPSQRKEVLRHFVVNTGEESIANFIDDSLGLLPKHGSTVKTGETWNIHRRVGGPIELHLINKCTLTELNDRIAEIEIHGTVTPSAHFGRKTSSGKKMQLMVTGGSITGNCRIRRDTGLPEQSEITRVLDMKVRLPDGRNVQQSKKTTTVIAVYSPQGSPKSIAAPSTAGPSKEEPRRISRVSGVNRR